MQTEHVTARWQSMLLRLVVVLIVSATWMAGGLSGCATGAPKATGTRAVREQPRGRATEQRPRVEQERYEHKETRELVALVRDAAKLLQSRGEQAFAALRVPNSRWRKGETYVFVLDPEGTMLVHPEAAMEGKNQLALEDVNGRPIIRGLIDAATAEPGDARGWYHYQWPVPGGLLPRWKSSYVELSKAPSGRRLIVGSGMYEDRMERAFVVDMVEAATAQVDRLGEAAFPLFRDPAGRFMAKDAYVFVIDPSGVERVNPAFPNLEGRNVLDVKDTNGKQLVREMLAVGESRGSGWVDYMWPKPGESVSTQKSTYVSKAKVGDEWLLVAAGVYLADAPRATATDKMSAPELMALVHDAATLLARHGEDAFPELRLKGSKWFRDDTYVFVWRTEGTRVFHAADPTLEGKLASEAKDVLGRPYGKMLLESIAASPSGEAWVHYMYPEPGDLFPTWKSSFGARVRFPSGQEHVVGAGVYNMKMDKALIEDVVDRASVLVAKQGRQAFDQLRDKAGPYRFMDVYVFVDTPEGIELVNPAQPSLEGTNVTNLKDVNGKLLAREYIEAALRDGEAWVEYYWYKPGHNTTARKQAYVRTVRSGDDTYIVGSGVYLDE